MNDDPASGRQALTTAEIGALAHLYRGEVYRSTIWRTRLDNTTNWSVVTMGIALSITFSSRDAPALPLVISGVLIAVFLHFEARRYRYFHVWRARARLMEIFFYAPMLRGEGDIGLGDWRNTLADDYCAPKHQLSYPRAVGRRLCRNYIWIFAIQAVAYYGKIAVHPAPISAVGELWERAAVGPLPGGLMVACGALFYGGLLALVGWSILADRSRERGHG